MSNEDVKLPEGITMKSYGVEDLLIQGPRMSPELYEQILADLPETIKRRVMGWRSTAR